MYFAVIFLTVTPVIQPLVCFKFVSQASWDRSVPPVTWEQKAGSSLLPCTLFAFHHDRPLMRESVHLYHNDLLSVSGLHANHFLGTSSKNTVAVIGVFMVFNKAYVVK